MLKPEVQLTRELCAGRTVFTLLGAFLVAFGAFAIAQERIVSQARFQPGPTVTEGRPAVAIGAAIVLVGVALLGIWWPRPKHFAIHALACLVAIPLTWTVLALTR